MVRLWIYRCDRSDRHEFWRDAVTCLARRYFGDVNTEISIRPGGKPEFNDSRCFFNISHSRNAVAVALADCEVGVDIELARPVSENLRRYCLTEREYREISPFDSLAFLRIWTAKESYLKLYGHGLRVSMSSFSALNDKYEGEGPPAYFFRVGGGRFTCSVATCRPQKVVCEKCDDIEPEN